MGILRVSGHRTKSNDFIERTGATCCLTAHIGEVLIDITDVQLVPKIIYAHTAYQIPLVPKLKS
ncbi:hypothetical protein [Vibrio phage J14]|nr:hypothetical protein [Vibrio phage J14]